MKFYITPVALQCRLTVSPSVAVTCRMQCDNSEQELGIVESNVGEKYRCTYFYIIRKTWQPTRPFAGSGATLGATWNHFCQIMMKRHHMQRKRKATCANKNRHYVKRKEKRYQDLVPFLFFEVQQKKREQFAKKGHVVQKRTVPYANKSRKDTLCKE